MKIGLAISSYQSDDEVIFLLKKIASELWPIDGIVVVDSLGSGKIKDYIINAQINNAEYKNFDVNLGSAGNLQKRLILSAEKGWDFVLALNHDALVTKITLQELLKYIDIPNLGALYPLKHYPSKKFYDYSGTKEVGPWRSFGHRSPTKDRLIPCIWSSSNGALYKLKPIRKGILPNGDLWMGWEDYLYGLDLRKAGYEQFLVSNAICEDNYEFTERRIGFKKIMLSVKPAWYHYYRTRNLWLIVLYFHPSVFRFFGISIRTIIEFVFICLGWSEAVVKKSLKLQFMGFIDSFKKITGKKDI